MTEPKCSSCGRELSPRTQERGFTRCYNCFMKSSDSRAGRGESSRPASVHDLQSALTNENRFT